jgi:SAM-dependent methyltransferase
MLPARVLNHAMNQPLHSLPAERNRQPILDQLLRLLPASGRALEIASGSGQHLALFATALPGWSWLASDPKPEARASVAAWWPAGPPALDLDVHSADWALPASHRTLDLIYCSNMLHASPASTGPALLAGAARHLAEGGRLLLYGPYIEPDRPTAPSNLAFDADLRARDPGWGLRRLDRLCAEAAAHDLTLSERIEMPANNLLLVFTHRPTP